MRGAVAEHPGWCYVREHGGGRVGGNLPDMTDLPGCCPAALARLQSGHMPPWLSGYIYDHPKIVLR